MTTINNNQFVDINKLKELTQTVILQNKICKEKTTNLKRLINQIEEETHKLNQERHKLEEDTNNLNKYINEHYMEENHEELTSM
jgi:hypothetical protein